MRDMNNLMAEKAIVGEIKEDMCFLYSFLCVLGVCDFYCQNYLKIVRVSNNKEGNHILSGLELGGLETGRGVYEARLKWACVLERLRVQRVLVSAL